MDIEPTQPTIRGLRDAGELEPLSKLDAEIFGDLAYPYFALRQLYDVHHRDLLVLELDARLIGYSLLVANRGEDVGWYLALGVENMHRGHGYGRRLAIESLRRLELQGVTKVRLTVEPDNTAAIRLYESLGFSGDRVEKNYLGTGRSRVLKERLAKQAPGPASGIGPAEDRFRFARAGTR